MSHAQITRYKDQAKHFTQAAKEYLLNAAKNTPTPKTLQNITEKQMTAACLALFIALYIEHNLGVPLVSGIPQMLGFVFTNIAHTMQLIANTTDPLGNSTAAYAALITSGYAIYRERQKHKNETPAPTENNNQITNLIVYTGTKMVEPTTPPPSPV